MTKLRVLVLFSTFAIVGIVGYFVALIARGYQFDTGTFKFLANGILVAKSDPDGASIFINNELGGATNTNLKLAPNTYEIEVKRDGYLSWKKSLIIKKEEVTQITAHLFKIAPALSPITYDGAKNPVVSSDFSKIAYTNNQGLWVMSVSTLPIGFANEPKKIAILTDTDAIYKFSPNARQILLTTKTGNFLLDSNQLNLAQDMVNVTAKLPEIQNEWNLEKTTKDEAQFKYVPDELAFILKNSVKNYTFSPDDNMVMYTASSEATLKDNLIAELPGSSTQPQSRDIKVGKTYIYDIKEDKNFEVLDNGRSLYWLPTSRHLIYPDEGKIIVMDYDGTNRQVVFSGNYIAPHAYPFINASKLLILTNLGSDSSTPNLYSLSIK
jgi:hypothetical protein